MSLSNISSSLLKTEQASLARRCTSFSPIRFTPNKVNHFSTIRQFATQKPNAQVSTLTTFNQKVAANDQTIRTYTTTGAIAKVQRKPLLSNQVDWSKVKFDLVKKNSRGGKFVPILYEGRRFVIQTPVFRVPFGIKKVEDESGTKFNLALSVENEPEMKPFTDFVSNLENAVREAATKNAKFWFNVEDPNKVKSIIEVGMRNVLRPPSDEKYAPLLNLKIPIYDDKPAVTVFYDHVLAPVEDIARNSKVMAILAVNSVWFAGGQFGIKLNPIQLAIVEKGEQGNYSFVAPENAAPASGEKK